MSPYLLVHRHGRHRVAGVGVEGEDVEDAAAVDEEPVLAQHQDLGRVQGAARQPSSVDVAQRRGQLGKIKIFTKIQKKILSNRYLDDVAPDNRLGQQPGVAQRVGLLPQQVVLSL